jgi:hypothetical protein
MTFPDAKMLHCGHTGKGAPIRAVLAAKCLTERRNDHDGLFVDATLVGDQKLSPRSL